MLHIILKQIQCPSQLCKLYAYSNQSGTHRRGGELVDDGTVETSRHSDGLNLGQDNLCDLRVLGKG